MEYSWIFFGLELAALVIFIISYTCDLEKRNWGWVKLTLILLFVVIGVFLFLMREKEGDGKFANTSVLPERSRWKTVFLEKNSKGRWQGVVKNLKTGESVPIEFKEKEKHFEEFEAGKMHSFAKWRWRELKPIGKETK